MSESDSSAELVAEKLRHTLDLIKAENDALRTELSHQRELNNHRLTALETQGRDFENRIRSLQDSATTFKTWSGLANGGSSILAITAFIRTLGLS